MRPVVERLTPMVRRLVVVLAIIFGVYLFAIPLRGIIDQHLALGPLVDHGEIWQPVTALFVHRDILSLFFNLLGLWFVGAAIERVRGARRFLTLFFVPAIAGNSVVALAGLVLPSPFLSAGCGDSVLGLFVALGVFYGPAQVRVLGSLVMQARILAAIFVGLAILSEAANGAWTLLLGTLTTVGIAYGLAGGRGQSLRELMTWVRQHTRGRHRYRVLDGGRSRDRRDRQDLLN